MTPGTGELRVEREGPIVTIALNRPAKRNALTPAMLSALDRGLAEADADASVHVIVLTGVGDHFCAGFDLGGVDPEELVEDRFNREREQLFDRALALRDLGTPTIASVRGACVAAGLLLSQMCDLVIAAEDAFFYDPLPRMGGVGLEVMVEPWDIGIRRTKRYLFTGERIPASAALEMGMVTDLAAPELLEEDTRALAERVAEMPPVTLALLKRSLNRIQDVIGMREALEGHFFLHQFGHATQESRELLHAAREGRSLPDYFRRRDEGKL